MGHVLNLIVKVYLYEQDVSDFEVQFKEQGLKGYRKMWRDRGEFGKLYNLVVHVIISGKHLELFIVL